MFGVIIIVIMRNYKKHSECPPKLKGLIAILNMLPNDVLTSLDELSDLERRGAAYEDIKKSFCDYACKLDDDLRRVLAELYGGDWVSWRHFLRRRINEKATLRFLIMEIKSGDFEKYYMLKNKFRSFNKAPGIWLGQGSDPLNIREIEKERFASMNINFKDITKDKLSETEWSEFERLSRHFNLFFIKTSVQPTLDKDGYLVLEADGLAKIITEERIKFERIRICPVCNLIFWAKKNSSETCGRKKCVDTLGNRKRLEKAKTKIGLNIELREQWRKQDFSK